MSSIISSSFFESAASVDALTLETCLLAFQNRSCRLGTVVEVLRLEVVVPKHVKVVLDEVGLLLLDRDGARPERRVLVGRVLLVDAMAGLGLDAGLLWVVDTARQVTVGASGGGWGEPTGQAGHGTPSLWG